MGKEVVSRAFVFLNCDIGSENDILKEVKGISGVFRASQLSGLYDIVADLRADSQIDIARIVRKLGLIERLRSSLTMIVSEENETSGRRPQ